jgi:hypothetical protein
MAARCDIRIHGKGESVMTLDRAWVVSSGGQALLRAVLAPSMGLALFAGLMGEPALGVAAPSLPTVQAPNINVTNDATHRWGEPEVAVDPKNPDHLVYAIVGEGFTNACQAAALTDPASPCALVNTVFAPQPLGLMNDVAHFSEVSVFVSFDRGRTWTRTADIPGRPLPADRDEEHRHGASWTDHEHEGDDKDDPPRGIDIFPIEAEPGDPLLTVGPDGTFYLGWDAIHFANLPTTIVNRGGIAVSKSTDGGLTWSDPVLTGTTIDRPFFATDLSAGVIYEASTGQVPGPLATGDATTPASGPADRHVVSSTDGVHWTTPQPFGLPPGTLASFMSAAHGLLANAFHSTDPATCGGAAPVVCIVFQTTSNAGASWNRHLLPPPTNYTLASSGPFGAPLVAADPSSAGHFSVALLVNSTRQFVVYQTHDAGATWSGPTFLSDDATKTRYHAWMAYSPNGTLGLMWKTNQPGPGPTFPYSVWAAISKDGGATFNKPLKISTADSPAPDARPFGNGGDDFSFITLNDETAYVAWADWRPVERAGFISAIDLRAFKR